MKPKSSSNHMNKQLSSSMTIHALPNIFLDTHHNLNIKLALLSYCMSKDRVLPIQKLSLREVQTYLIWLNDNILEIMCFEEMALHICVHMFSLIICRKVCAHNYNDIGRMWGVAVVSFPYTRINLSVFKIEGASTCIETSPFHRCKRGCSPSPIPEKYWFLRISGRPPPSWIRQ